MSRRESAIDFWRARPVRERAALGAAASVVALALLYGLVWEPGMAARQKLSATLPRLRSQLADMRLQQKEVMALRKQLQTAPQRADLKALLQGSAAGAPFGRSVERVETVAAGRVLVRAGPADFDAWLDWIAGIQRDFGARVDTCKIVATGQPGLVRIETTFVASSPSVARAAQ